MVQQRCREEYPQSTSLKLAQRAPLPSLSNAPPERVVDSLYDDSKRPYTVRRLSNGRRPVVNSLYDEPQRSFTVSYRQSRSTSSRRLSHGRQEVESPPPVKSTPPPSSYRYTGRQIHDVRHEESHARDNSVQTYPGSVSAKLQEQPDRPKFVEPKLGESYPSN